MPGNPRAGALHPHTLRVHEPAATPHRRPAPQSPQPSARPSGHLPAERSPATEHSPPAEPGPSAGHGPSDEIGPSAEHAAAAPRNAFFDNAKYLAIVLVAMGHSWEPLLSGSRTTTGLYLFVYTFHMPAFIVVSGYFSRRFDAGPGRLKRLITGVAVPYVLFETAYALFRRWPGGHPHNAVSLLDPWFLTWFLPALFVWRLTAPLWRQIRHPLPVAVAVAALASLCPSIGDDLDLQRILQYLPFFVLGLLLGPEHFTALSRRPVRLAALPVGAAALLTAYWAAPRMNFEWLYHYDSAQELAAPWWSGPTMTLALLACSLLLTACFLAWVPRGPRWFTTLGTGTMYGFLLHGFLVKGAKYAGWYEAGWMHGPAGEVTVTLAAATAVTLLCTAPVRGLFRWAVEPRMEWAFRRR